MAGPARRGSDDCKLRSRRNRPLDGEEAAWLLNVAAPSAGKTEAVNLLDSVTNGRLNEITSAGLLGWSRGKDPQPVGILTRNRRRADN